MNIKILIICLTLLVSDFAYAHAGPHGNDECLVQIGNTELRLNGYQFQGRNPDRHYCRHYPFLGQTIIKIDSVSSDLSGMAVELQLLKRKSWLGLILNNEDAFSVINQLPAQNFSKRVVSIDSDIQARDVYAIKLKLHALDGTITEQRLIFLVGIPFAQVMVAIAVLLLLMLAFVALRPSSPKR